MVSSSEPPATNSVFAEFKRRAIRPVTYTFEAYDATAILIKAIDIAIQSNGGRIPTRGEVLTAVARTKDFAGTSGNFTFLPSGDPLQPAVGVYQMVNGDWIFSQTAI